MARMQGIFCLRKWMAKTERGRSEVLGLDPLRVATVDAILSFVMGIFDLSTSTHDQRGDE